MVGEKEVAHIRPDQSVSHCIGDQSRVDMFDGILGLFFVFGLFQIFKKSWHLFLDILGKGFHIAIVSCDLHLGRTVSVFDVLLVVDPKLSVHGCIDQLHFLDQAQLLALAVEVLQVGGVVLNG